MFARCFDGSLGSPRAGSPRVRSSAPRWLAGSFATDRRWRSPPCRAPRLERRKANARPLSLEVERPGVDGHMQGTPTVADEQHEYELEKQLEELIIAEGENGLDDELEVERSGDEYMRASRCAGVVARGALADVEAELDLVPTLEVLRRTRYVAPREISDARARLRHGLAEARRARSRASARAAIRRRPSIARRGTSRARHVRSARRPTAAKASAADGPAPSRRASARGGAS